VNSSKKKGSKKLKTTARQSTPGRKKDMVMLGSSTLAHDGSAEKARSIFINVTLTGKRSWEGKAHPLH